MAEQEPAAEAPAAPPPPALPDWVQAVTAAVPDGVTAVLGVEGGGGPADTPTLVVEPRRWFEVAAATKAQGFDFFCDVAGCDYPERPQRIAILAHLRDLDRGRLVRLETAVDADGELASLEPLFPGAGWPEREIFDLLGVGWRGNADLRRLMLPDDWDGHPLRRDYPLEGPRALNTESPYAL